MTQPVSADAVVPRAVAVGEAHSRPRLQRLADVIDRNVFVVLVLAAAGLMRVSLLGLGIGSDTWYTLLGGRVVSHSWIPHADALAVLSRGREWVDEQWLAHVVFYGMWSVGGWRLSLLVMLGSYLGAFAVAAATARRLGSSARSTAIAALLCLVLAMGASGFRAQTLAYLLFALVLLLLLEDELRPSRRVYLALPLLVIWANIHGSVVLGAALVALRGVTIALGNGRSKRAMARATLLVVAPWPCLLVSPYGLSLPGYYWRLLHNPTLSRFVSEWQPATVRNDPFFFILLLGALLLVSRRRVNVGLFATLALLATVIGGLMAIRHVVWFALTAAAVLPSALDELRPPPEAPRRRRLNLYIAASATAVLVLASAAYASHGNAWFERGYPARAGDAVAAAAAANPSAKVFAVEQYADWLLFEHPALEGRVAYDVRFELLTGRELTRIAMFRLEQGTNWLRVANDYRIIVLDPSHDAGAVKLLTRERGSRTLYADHDVVVIDRGARR